MSRWGGGGAVPDEIDALMPGAEIEVVVRDEDFFASDSTHTNPLLALTRVTHDELVEIADVLDAWERSVEEVEEYTAERVAKILGTAPATTLEELWSKVVYGREEKGGVS